MSQFFGFDIFFVIFQHVYFQCVFATDTKMSYVVWNYQTDQMVLNPGTEVFAGYVGYTSDNQQTMETVSNPLEIDRSSNMGECSMGNFNSLINSLSPGLCIKSFNSLAPGKVEWNFETDFSDWSMRHLLWNCPDMNVTGPHWWSVNIGSGNGLVPSGTKPLPEPVLTQIYVAIWHH